MKTPHSPSDAPDYEYESTVRKWNAEKEFREIELPLPDFMFLSGRKGYSPETVLRLIDQATQNLRAQLHQQSELVEKCMAAMNENADRGAAAEAELAKLKEAALTSFGNRHGEAGAGKTPTAPSEGYEPKPVAAHKCNPHPDAPHGFDRNGSHSLDRYVCECESWTPPEAKQEPEGPLVDGWQLSVGEGWFGYGVYAHMTEYPEEGAMLMLGLEPPEPATEAKQEPWVALQAATDFISAMPHGDNCFVSDHYEGDPGNRCNCGKDSIESYLVGVLEHCHPAPVNTALLSALKWLDRWMGHKPLHECANKVRAAIAAATGEVK